MMYLTSNFSSGMFPKGENGDLGAKRRTLTPEEFTNLIKSAPKLTCTIRQASIVGIVSEMTGSNLTPYQGPRFKVEPGDQILEFDMSNCGNWVGDNFEICNKDNIQYRLWTIAE